jgi:general secretion pathway protein G
MDNHRQGRPVRPGSLRRRSCGFTLIELLLAVALLGVLLGIAIPSYRAYLDRSNSSKAVSDIVIISASVRLYWDDVGACPDTLAQIGMSDMRDPWGNPYQFLNLQNLRGNGQARKNRSLVPINTDFDLYSMGPDGRSVGPLTAAASRDDIIRANDGRYIGKASDY